MCQAKIAKKAKTAIKKRHYRILKCKLDDKQRAFAQFFGDTDQIH